MCAEFAMDDSGVEGEACGIDAALREVEWVRLFCDSGKPSRYRSLDPPEMSIGDG